MTISLRSLPGVAHVERVDGDRADPSAPPRLLIEVPHGADERAHYDALRARMVGALPHDLHVFFHVNTDVGAWSYGRRVAERVLLADPTSSALLVRCLVPRTFVDTNRLVGEEAATASGGMTAGIAPYVNDVRDVALLVGLHRAYVGLVEEAYELVCNGGGFALSPHTYGPRTMDITQIDDQIVHALRRAHQPAVWTTWPIRAEIDLITRDAAGVRHAPSLVVERLLCEYRALGHEVVESGSYTLHPATQGMRWAIRWPEQFLSLEVRRDLLVAPPYTPFEEMRPLPALADRYAAPIADAIGEWARARR